MPIFQLPDEILFPDPSYAEDDGLLAIGGDLSAERLLAAYSQGIFPWYSSQEPILWWSPDPRLVLFPDRLRISASLQRKINNHHFKVRFDTAFEQVISHCAETERKHEAGTWITPEMQAAYNELHRKGFAHSVETYDHGKLAGGLYGVSLGRAFFGESMFHLQPDASKVALFYLVEKAKEFNFLFIDSQVETSHMVSMGAELIPRVEYMKILKEAMGFPTVKGKWCY
ncbi:MAG: leucyl/phenylalanyl-tRNA--protein transferase [Bacteroidetes bacterium]|nr:leucyl/phenylalanyl-tRNA--protein transferase [Bacteroidota bacterium]